MGMDAAGEVTKAGGPPARRFRAAVNPVAQSVFSTAPGGEGAGSARGEGLPPHMHRQPTDGIDAALRPYATPHARGGHPPP